MERERERRRRGRRIGDGREREGGKEREGGRGGREAGREGVTERTCTKWVNVLHVYDRSYPAVSLTNADVVLLCIGQCHPPVG